MGGLGREDEQEEEGEGAHPGDCNAGARERLRESSGLTRGLGQVVQESVYLPRGSCGMTQLPRA